MDSRSRQLFDGSPEHWSMRRVDSLFINLVLHTTCQEHLWPHVKMTQLQQFYRRESSSLQLEASKAQNHDSQMRYHPSLVTWWRRQGGQSTNNSSCAGVRTRCPTVFQIGTVRLVLCSSPAIKAISPPTECWFFGYKTAIHWKGPTPSLREAYATCVFVVRVPSPQAFSCACAFASAFANYSIYWT